MSHLLFTTRPLGLFFSETTASQGCIATPLPLLCRLASTLSSSDRRSHYDVLGLTMGASAAEIKAKYYELSKELHPDRHHRVASDGNHEEHRRRKNEMNKRYVRVKEAYEVLKDSAKRAAFDAELTGGGYSDSNSPGSGWSTTRNARSNDHYYGHTRYSGTQHQASSFHRRSRPRGTAADPHDYTTKHEAYTNATHRSAQHAGGRDPLRPTARTGSNYDVPHFDFDKHYHQQRSYDNHRKIQNMKMAQKHFKMGDGDAAAILEQQRRQSAFHSGGANQDPFLHHGFNPYSRPTRPLLTLTGPRLAFIFSGFVGTVYLIIKNLF